MEWLVWLGLTGALGAGAAAFLRSVLLGQPPAVRALGLRQVGMTKWFGAVGGHEVALSLTASRRLRFEVWGAPAALSMEPRGPSLPAHAVVTGDAALDAVAALSGDPAEVLAHLPPDARAVLAEAARAGITLDRGVVHGLASTVQALDRIALAVGLVQRLPALVADPRDVLAERVRADPDGGVRLRALDLLRGTGPWATRAAEAAAADADARVRLLSAEIRDDAVALGALVVAADVPGEVRDRAFTRLRERAPDALRQALLAALAAPGTASAALHRIGVLRDPALAEAVLVHARRLLEEGRLDAVGDALVHVLASLPPERTHDVLLALVKAAPTNVARAAVRLLSRNADTATLVGLGEIASVRKELVGTITEAAGVAAVDALGVRVAGALGLIYIPEHHAAKGVIDDLLVEVRLGAGVAVTVTELPETPPVVPRERALAPHADEAFHRAWRVPGEPADLAWFPPDVRERFVAAGEGAQSLAVLQGRMRVVGGAAGEDGVVRRVGVVLAAARALVAVAELEPSERLVRAWRAETAPALRRRLVRAALAHDAFAAEGALSDPDPSVARTAARLLRRGDRLADLAASRAAPSSERRGALHDLASLGDRASLVRAVTAALADADTAPLAVAIAGRAGLAEVAPAVGRYVTARAPIGSHWQRLDDPKVRSALRTLASFADPSTEPVLVAGLACSDGVVRRQIVEVLGRIGGPASLEALRPLAAGWSVGADAVAARVAVERIRERGGRGALALAATEGGHVAIATAGGEVAVVPDDQ